MWILTTAIIHYHRINRCPSLVKAISMLSYHLLAISRLQQANHLKSIWKNHTRAQQKVEIDYQSRCSTQSGQLIRVSRIAVFVIFYKDFDVTRVHTGGNCLQNGVSLVNMLLNIVKFKLSYHFLSFADMSIGDIGVFRFMTLVLPPLL
jgi:hypothetical protein